MAHRAGTARRPDFQARISSDQPRGSAPPVAEKRWPGPCRPCTPYPADVIEPTGVPSSRTASPPRHSVSYTFQCKQRNRAARHPRQHCILADEFLLKAGKPQLIDVLVRGVVGQFVASTVKLLKTQAVECPGPEGGDPVLLSHGPQGVPNLGQPEIGRVQFPRQSHP